MRIYSPTIGLLSASLASTAVGSGVTFDTKGFEGAILPYNGGTTQSTCLNQTQIDNGNDTPGQWMIKWSPSKSSNGPTINSIVLAAKEDPDTSIAYGTDSSQSTTSRARSLLIERDPIQRDDNSQDPQFFLADFTGGSLSLAKEFVDSTLTSHQNKPLFFQVGWTDDSTGLTGYSYSLLWALASDAVEAASLLSQYPSLVTSASPAYTQATSAIVTTGAMPTTTGATSSSDASSSSSSSTSSAATASGSVASSGSKAKAKSGGLSTGAIVGIAVGVVAALMIISVIAGCFCFRRRRRMNNQGAIGGQDGGSRDTQAMQDMMLAEKEARVGIMEGDQPDTPYSERAPPNPLGRGGLAMNESGVDMGVGQAVSGDNDDGIAPCDRDQYYNNNNNNNSNTAGSDRHSGVYISPVMGPASSSNNSSPTHSHPSSSSIYEPPSVPCPSTQQDHDYTYDVGPAPGTTVGGLPPCKQALLRQQQQHDYSHHVAPPCPSTQQDHTYTHDVGPAPGTTVGGLPPCRQAQLRQQQQQQQQYDYSQHHHHVVADGGGGGRGCPDENQPISPDSARGSRGAGFGSRSATPSGISGRYAHLIEEGMTEDEIRRMEEEERALDEAIERHGRG
ncbi:hypothetical protein VMCG_01579 [Cytospora schulzeri]|uniref:Mid2 domain-containing protein n=1 Tax=Cytospora schulzeri TaxID=448051 RepID=A0A423X5Z6_9PEZI|nr:hypothetical protein VMCG_01579 [Valsa malicola]